MAESQLRDAPASLTIIIPVQDEVDNIQPLIGELEQFRASRAEEIEVIVVDDGSRDESLPILRTMARGNECVRVISFRRNFGKSAALATGFRAARGQYVVTMDADLQDDPAEIPALIAKSPAEICDAGTQTEQPSNHVAGNSDEPRTSQDALFCPAMLRPQL